MSERLIFGGALILGCIAAAYGVFRVAVPYRGYPVQGRIAGIIIATVGVIFVSLAVRAFIGGH